MCVRVCVGRLLKEEEERVIFLKCFKEMERETQGKKKEHEVRVDLRGDIEICKVQSI